MSGFLFGVLVTALDFIFLSKIGKSMRETAKGLVPVQCAWCGEFFYTNKAELETHNFCSGKCRHEHQQSVHK